MHSEWMVTRNYVGDRYIFAVYRVKNAAEVMHCGNMEFASEYMDDEQAASEIAARLNKDLLIKVKP